jgi:hypothetical protein
VDQDVPIVGFLDESFREGRIPPVVYERITRGNAESLLGITDEPAA